MVGIRLWKPLLDLCRQRAATRGDDIRHMEAVVHRGQMAAAMTGVHQGMQEIVGLIAFISVQAMLGAQMLGEIRTGEIGAMFVRIVRMARPGADIMQIAYRHQDRVHQRSQHQQRHRGLAKQKSQGAGGMTRHGQRCYGNGRGLGNHTDCRALRDQCLASSVCFHSRGDIPKVVLKDLDSADSLP